ncbi:UPF0753 protein [Planctomycetota bacterium]|nr:UPF0753 protein [Planctomycetota bacterium]
MTTISSIATDLEAIVLRVCRQVPPMWALPDLVAVNPYQGHADLGLVAAEDRLQRRQGGRAVPGWAILHQAWTNGEFTAADLVDAVREAGPDAPDACTTVSLLVTAGGSPASPRVRSAAAVLDQQGRDGWTRIIAQHLGAFLAARTDRGISRWVPQGSAELYPAWRSWMAHDRSFSLRGLSGSRAWVGNLEADPAAARAALLGRMGLADHQREDYLASLLGDLPGWAGNLRRQAWDTAQDAVGQLPDLLTIRLAYDGLLHDLHGDHPLPVVPPATAPAALHRDRGARMIALLAWEHAWRRSIAKRLAPVPAASPRPAVQAVFCIDVRSEPFRRQLEAVDGRIATYGFAGFFAMTVAVVQGAQRQAQCPVLLAPAAAVGLPAIPAKPWSRVLGSLRRSAVGGFAYMETAGLTHGLSLLRGALGRNGAPVQRPQESAHLNLGSLAGPTRVGLLRGLLRNLGLGEHPARLVLLCGHDSTCANNPQAAALACGACGGHSGAVNARLAARLYNDPELRRALGASAPPAESWAVAGVHDTATDLVRLLDLGDRPASHRDDVDSLRTALDAAGAGARRVRAAGLPGIAAGADLDRNLDERSRHWAELRPEWGLADNAAFIAAPRAMTAGSDLGGRCFLHSYDEALDEDGALLALILTAPVVVASWINLQYFASTIDPDGQGSGSKTIHTVVGGLGVATGGDGDLRPGLAWQSVHDGSRLRHRPLRLQVFIAAQTARIDQVVAGHAHLRDLVANGWIGLHAVDPATARCSRRLPTGGWQPLSGEPS